MPSFLRPDVLVLGGGGTLGEAWMNGVLAGIEESSGVDLREVEAFVGTSAGSIVAANLAAGRHPRRPRDLEADAGEPMPGVGAALRLAGRSATPLLARAMRYEGIPGAALRGAALKALPRGTRTLERLERSLERAKTEFDGRLRVVCVERQSGRRMVFGAPGAAAAPVSRAVVASCSIPAYFEPVEIGDREYVDGGVWSVTNLDVAPAGRGATVLCLNPVAGLPLALTSPLQLLRGRLGAEMAVLARRGVRVSVVGPWSEAAARMARSLMDDRERDFVHAAGYAQGLRLP